MKSATYVLIVAAMLSLCATDAVARGSHSSSGGSHYVHGYTTKKGTYVKGHMQTNPNGTKSDNWSTKGNVNPYTGKAGTKNPN